MGYMVICTLTFVLVAFYRLFLFLVMTVLFLPTELPYNDYFEYYGPDFKLHISPSNMANQNTPEYMDKIKVRLFENMRMLPHAPGVQMSGE